MATTKNTARFTSPPVVGETVTGISEGTTHGGRRSYATAWSGVYEGIRASEWTGEPVYFFGAGIIGTTPQKCFAIPVSRFASTLFAWAHGDCDGTFGFLERLPAATVYACGTCGQHRVVQDNPEAHNEGMRALADLLIDTADQC